MAKQPQSKSFDMAEHEKTYSAFMHLTKLAIIAMVFIVLALYALIVADQPWLGWFLLIISVPAAMVIGRKPRSQN